MQLWRLLCMVERVALTDLLGKYCMNHVKYKIIRSYGTVLR